MAGLRVFFQPYASPGDVESKDLATPETLVKWQEAAKKALSEQGNFTECELKPTGGQNAAEKCLINVTQVQNVIAI